MTASLRWTFVVVLVLSCHAAGTSAMASCPDADHLKFVADGDGCLALVHFGISAPENGKTIVVVLHGDGRGTLGAGAVEDYTILAQRVAENNTRNVFLMIRPGYQSPVGKSTGWANPNDDDYTPKNVARVATAVQRLKAHYQSPRVVLIGHSGGAATSALILGRHHGIADAAILLGCPCDVPNWRSHRGGTWRQSLNPLDAAGDTPRKTPVIAITGVNDDNTLPRFAQRYIDKVNIAGGNGRFVTAERHDHKSVVRLRNISSFVDQVTAEIGAAAAQQ